MPEPMFSLDPTKLRECMVGSEAHGDELAKAASDVCCALIKHQEASLMKIGKSKVETLSARGWAVLFNPVETEHRDGRMFVSQKSWFVPPEAINANGTVNWAVVNTHGYQLS